MPDPGNHDQTSMIACGIGRLRLLRCVGLIAALVASFGAYANQDHALPAGPWSHHYESALADTFSGPIARLAPLLLKLNQDEVALLTRMLADYHATMEVKLQTWRRTKIEWDQRMSSVDGPDGVSGWLRLCVQREIALAPIADEQAAAERDLLDAVRCSFSDGHADQWPRFEYAVVFATSPMPGAHIATGSIDLVALLDTVTACFPNSPTHAAELEALVVQYCDMYVRLADRLRTNEVRVMRATSRRLLRQLEQPPRGLDSNVTSEPLTRRATEALPKIRRGALELTSLVLTSLQRFSTALEEPASSELRRRFWTEIASRCQFVFWPPAIEEFRQTILAVADQEEREVLVALFEAAYRAALDRVTADEAWLRGVCDASFSGSGGQSDADQALRARQERGCELLNLLCKQALEVITIENRSKLKLPNFRIAPTSAVGDVTK